MCVCACILCTCECVHLWVCMYMCVMCVHMCVCACKCAHVLCRRECSPLVGICSTRISPAATLSLRTELTMALTPHPGTSLPVAGQPPQMRLQPQPSPWWQVTVRRCRPMSSSHLSRAPVRSGQPRQAVGWGYGSRMAQRPSASKMERLCTSGSVVRFTRSKCWVEQEEDNG